MKKCAVILLSALVFMMCTKEKSRLHEVELKQAEEMKSGIRVENVFLDMKYGMSQGATFSRFRQLAYEGVIDLGKGSVFEYTMKLDTQSVKVGFHTEFFHDSLYSFSLILKGKSETEAEALRQLMLKELKGKYGEPFVIPSEEDTTKRDFYFVKDNQRIELLYPFQARKSAVTYVDYPAEIRMIQEEIRLEKEARKKKAEKK
jgi:hypothetical protein